MPIPLFAIASYLHSTLGGSRFANEQSAIYRSSERPVRRLGLALEPWKDIGGWVQEERLDALFLHRPWRLVQCELPSDIGILTAHLAFDSALTFGFNLRLATALQMEHPVAFAHKNGIPRGMLGTLARRSPEEFIGSLLEIFGSAPHLDGLQTGKLEALEYIAVVGAMTDALVREAAERGVQLYITGEFRQPARKAVEETGMLVAVIGHAEGERWGLRALAGLLRERWAELEVVVNE